MTNAVPTNFDTNINAGVANGIMMAAPINIYVDGILKQTQEIILTATGLSRSNIRRTNSIGAVNGITFKGKATDYGFVMLPQQAINSE